MRIVIPGGSGLIGQALAQDLARDGHQVVVLTRSPENADRGLSSVRYEHWDGQTSQGWIEQIEGADAVVNLAGESIGGENTFQILFQRWTSAKKQRILESRRHAGQAIVEAITAVGRRPSVLVQPVGSGYYGTHTEGEQDESSPPGDDFLADTVRATEDSTAHVETLGVRRVIFRSGIVLSAKGGTLPMMLLPFRLFAGGPLGHGRQRIPWIHLKDMVAAIRFAIDRREVSGVYNLAAPGAETYAEMGRAIGRQLHRPYWFPMPAFALRLLLGEKAILILEGQRLSPRKLMDLGFRYSFPDIKSALADLLS
ncbi:MAG TPA: TIGR01777 family oxidoreductase [Anaerolineales bacterium]|nr:TIGR01777 family oxidoreductase [Anaerolineales bacterium]